MTQSNYGDFSFAATVTGPIMVSSTGAYFSEISGFTSGDVSLSMVR